MKHNLSIIKIGGSVITDKSKPYTVHETAINEFAHAFTKKVQAVPEQRYILGNGAGSFGHYSATKYHMMEGFQTPEHITGYAIVQDDVARLNRMVITALHAEGLPAVSFHASSMTVTKNGDIISMDIRPLVGLLQQGIIPVLYGDIVYDTQKGCSIVSTETLLARIVEHIDPKKFHIHEIMFITKTGGILDENGNIVPIITDGSINTIHREKMYDVTGSIVKKIESAKHLSTVAHTPVQICAIKDLLNSSRGTIIKSH